MANLCWYKDSAKTVQQSSIWICVLIYYCKMKPAFIWMICLHIIGVSGEKKGIRMNYLNLFLWNMRVSEENKNELFELISLKCANGQNDMVFGPVVSKRDYCTAKHGNNNSFALLDSCSSCIELQNTLTQLIDYPRTIVLVSGACPFASNFHSMAK